jgi:hypothetical protein
MSVFFWTPTNFLYALPPVLYAAMAAQLGPKAIP